MSRPKVDEGKNIATETTKNTVEPFIACAVQYNWEFYGPNLKDKFKGRDFKERNPKRNSFVDLLVD